MTRTKTTPIRTRLTVKCRSSDAALSALSASDLVNTCSPQSVPNCSDKSGRAVILPRTAGRRSFGAFPAMWGSQARFTLAPKTCRPTVEVQYSPLHRLRRPRGPEALDDGGCGSEAEVHQLLLRRATVNPPVCFLNDLHTCTCAAFNPDSDS